MVSAMKTTLLPEDLCAGVFAVPPLARRTDPSRTLDLEQNNLIVRHIISGGITRLLYGGNAFLYHLTLAEYEQLLEWLPGATGYGLGLSHRARPTRARR